jgi:hypothetical protein
MTSELDLLQGTLDVLVLRALSFAPMHGYAVARFIRNGSDGSFKVLDGALYTSLHRMEERGWIDSEWGNSDRGKRAKFYRDIPPASRRGGVTCDFSGAASKAISTRSYDSISTSASRN